MTASRWITLIIVLFVLLIAVLFTVQNSSRLTDLSLDIWFTAFHLQAPQPVPYLLWSAFGLGLLGGGGWGMLARAADRGRLRELEAELARVQFRRADDDWT